ncbi:MAG: hypothetical protein A2V66_17600 [Ignavibacteria bacterium RBG_13_36_8]|nr:MAG: hypothetical protein A2V66_17600 [Ignavibacteria bacterium RBG_13_36_8]
MKRVLNVRTNKIFIYTLLFGLLICGKIMPQSVEAIPNVIAFQGIISDTNRNKLADGNYNVSFSLYDSPEGGNLLWSQNYNNYKIDNGFLQVLLGGEQDSNPIGVRFDKKYYLEIKIEGGKYTNKRIELGGSGYSLGSKFALEVDDGAITTEKIKDLAVTNEKIQSVDFSKAVASGPDPYSVYWTIDGNIIAGPERNYIGTIEKKDFVIKTFSIERMRFDPYGKVYLGTEEDSVDFEVIGKSKFCDVHIKGDLGIGILPGAAKVHVDSDDKDPFKVDVNDNNVFKIDTEGRVEINSTLGSGIDSNPLSYPLYISSLEQGIAIRVDNSSDNDNNFVSFWDDDGMTGRIEGESYLNYLADPENIARAAYITVLGIADVAAIALATTLEPASAIAFTAELLYNEVIIELEHINLGVTYESGSGDYAEWLERLDPNEDINPGDIVGIHKGKISKLTANADQLLCTSFSPIVLGNQPGKGKESFYEKTAFLGQVPVKVIGVVNEGDYIIPSGLEDGCGIAVSPDMMTIEEYQKVVGRAWGSSNNSDIKYVNTAIGFDNREIVRMLKLYQKRQNELKEVLVLREQNIEKAKEELGLLIKDLSFMNEKYEASCKTLKSIIDNQPEKIKMVRE